jgi:hypothetical protein
MGKVINTKIIPKVGHLVTVKLPANKTEDDLLQWCRDTCRKTTYWRKIGFAGPQHNRHSRPPSMKRNFANSPDMEWTYEMFFTSKADGALFKMFWS